MNSDWILVILAFLVLVFIPRFIVEWAWVRRRRAQQQAGVGPTSIVRPPWFAFVAFGLVGAVAAALVIALAR